MENVLKSRPKDSTPSSTTARNPIITHMNTTPSGSRRQQPPSPSPAAAVASSSRYPVPPAAGISPRPSTDGSRLGPPRNGSTANPLETSKLVISVLKEVEFYVSKRAGKGKEVSVPVGDAARHALGIVEIIREIAHDNVEENLALLASESSALVYIVIDSCKQELNKTGNISDRKKIDLGGLTSNLNAIQTFVHKHVTRSFAKRLLKHGDDMQMIMVQRRKLQYWLTRFLANDEANEPISILDALDRLVQQDLERATGRKRHSSTDKAVSSSMTSNTMQKLTRGKTLMENKPLPVPAVEPSPSEKPIHNVREKNHNEDKTHDQDIINTTMSSKPLIRALPRSPAPNIQTHSRAMCCEEKEVDDAELRRKARRERQKAERKAENARWLKSEEEFNKLPLISDLERLDDGLLNDSPKATSSSQRPPRTRPPPISLPRNDKRGRILHDLKLEGAAAEIQKQAQRELIEKDKNNARILSAKLEAEDRWLKLDRRSVDSVESSMYAPESPRPHPGTKDGGNVMS